MEGENTLQGCVFHLVASQRINAHPGKPCDFTIMENQVGTEKVPTQTKRRDGRSFQLVFGGQYGKKGTKND
ncbi:hypothetical protein H5410_061509, partial [Solanum commersonii]